MSSFDNLSLLHPDIVSEVITNFDVDNIEKKIYVPAPQFIDDVDDKDAFVLSHNNFMKVDGDEDEDIITPQPKRINRGNGKMDYIEDSHSRMMLENAWQAINLTETWDFVAQDTESFMFSDDDRIWVITRKMEELGYGGHSGCSFGLTMREMQFLAQEGVEKFKEGYIKKQNEKKNKTSSQQTREENRQQPPPVGYTATYGNTTFVFGGSFP